MFRRKTDQVYATLQQVQRRITDQNAGTQQQDIFNGPPVVNESSSAQALRRATASAGVHVFDRTATALASPGSATLAADPPRGDVQRLAGRAFPTPEQLSAPIAPPPVQDAPRPGPGRFQLRLSAELASMVLLVWLVSLGLAYTIGLSKGRRGGADAGFAAGAAGNRATTDLADHLKPATGSTGTSILVLESVTRDDAQAEHAFLAKSDALNAVARSNAARGYKPWFGLRHPVNGGLQLVFGVVDGRFGVDKDAYGSFAEELRNRAGWKEAHWMSLDDH